MTQAPALEPAGDAADFSPMNGSDSPPPEPDQLGAGIDFTDPNSPLAPYYLRASHVVAVVLIAAAALFANLGPLQHTDIWGHLKFGQWMVQHRAFPEHEPFCPFADQEAEYVHFQWLSQVGFYCIYSAGENVAGGEPLARTAGGVEALRAAHAVLVAALFTLLLFGYRRACASLPLACAGLVVLFLLSPGLTGFLRPQVLALVFFAATLLLLSRAEPSWRVAWQLPMLLVLWANCHGSFLVGLALTGVFLAGRAIEAVRTSPSWSPAAAWRDAGVRHLLLALPLSALAVGLFNPHGPALYLHVWRLSRNPNVATFHEWQPLELSLGSLPAWSYFVSLALVVLAPLLARRWPTPTQVLLVALFGLPPLWQQRMLVWWFVVVPWVVLPHWKAFGERLRGGAEMQASVLSFRKTLLAIFALVVLLLWSGPAQWLLQGSPRPLEQSVSAGTPWQVAEQLRTAPEESALPPLAAALKENYPEGKYRGAVFASETQGDYLLWVLPAECPVVVYTHVHLFSPEHWRRCIDVKQGKANWREFCDARGVNLIVVEGEWHGQLRKRVLEDGDWLVVLDETGKPDKRDPGQRLFVALRKKPL